MPPPPLTMTMTYPQPEKDVLPKGINRSFVLFFRKCYSRRRAEVKIGTVKVDKRMKKAEGVHVQYAAVDVVLG